MEQEFSNAEFQEMEDDVRTQILEVRRILEQKPKFVVPDHCDEFIARCLRIKDGNVEKAVNLVKTFYACTGDLQTWNISLLPSLHDQFYNRHCVTPLVDSDPTSGCKIVIVRIGLWNPKETPFEQALACLWMFSQYGNAEYPIYQRKGFIMIWDFANFSISHLWAVNQWKLISMAKYLQNGVIGRMKAFHFVNHPRPISLLYKAIKPFLKEKLKRRVHFHDNIEGLLDQVPAKVLPTYLKGSQDPDQCVDKPFIHGIHKMDIFFQDMMKQRFPEK